MNLLPETEQLILDVLKTNNINSNPNTWEKSYKTLKTKLPHQMSYEQFDAALTNLLNYYYKISLNYKDGKFDEFIIRP